MDNQKLLKLHRVQSDTQESVYADNKQVPVKRVLISPSGKINFNPNDRQYIYFSKTDEHHIYYIFTKVLGIILEELKKHNTLKSYQSLHLPENLPPYFMYTQAYTSIIREVKDFFKNYIPPICVELVTLNYLHEFSNFFEKASVPNKRKKVYNTPEISDNKYFGGAYGVNDAWLTLLKTCTVSTNSSKIDLDCFFDFMLDNTYHASTCRTTLKQLIQKNPEFLNLLKMLTYTDLQNPEFLNKNNINNMRKAIKEIEKKKLFNPASNFSRHDFAQERKNLKDEINLYR